MIKTPNYQKVLREHTDNIILFAHMMDKLMSEGNYSGVEFGSKAAELMNWINMRNDSVRYSVLGVDFRRDDKDKLIKKLLEKGKVKDGTTL
jgi:hypothetical protein